jgi:regulator of replication initiation timing
MKPPSKAPDAPPAPDYVDTITKLTAALQEKTAQLAAHEEKDARRSKELTEANANNAELVAKVESLEAEVTSLNGQVASLTTENGELKGQVTNLREDNGNLQVTVTSLNEQLVESDRIAKTPFVHGWIYTPDHGWLNINPDNFPIIYKNSTKTWHFYEQGSISPRYFYNFNEQKWEAWDSIPSGSEN